MRKSVVAALFLAAACSRQHYVDELTRGRQQLHVVPCGAEPAIAGVTSIHRGDPRAADLGDWVIVSICHLDALMKQADAAQQPLDLFIDGQDFDNPLAGIDFESGQVTFILGRNARNQHHWNPLLYDPLFEPKITLFVSAGIHGGRPLPRAEQANATIELRKLHIDWTTQVLLALLAAILLVLIIVARTTDLVRDGPSIAGVRQPYSVARVQMAWWFFLILTGFLYIWLVTGATDTISPSLLALMGISAATAVAAVIISPTEARVAARGTLMNEEIAVLDHAIDQIVIDIADTETRNNVELKEALARRRADLEKRRALLIEERSSLGTVAASQGFWRDLVTDDRGAIALDRFQIVAWTVILGAVFVQNMLWELAMPEFSATTLALMGISSGTYIGFKLPQK